MIAGRQPRAPIRIPGSPLSPVRRQGKGDVLAPQQRQQGGQGLQALSPHCWPPLGAFIKLPALRVVHDCNERGGIMGEGVAYASKVRYARKLHAEREETE